MGWSEGRDGSRIGPWLGGDGWSGAEKGSCLEESAGMTGSRGCSSEVLARRGWRSVFGAAAVVEVPVGDGRLRRARAKIVCRACGARKLCHCCILLLCKGPSYAAMVDGKLVR